MSLYYYSPERPQPPIASTTDPVSTVETAFRDRGYSVTTIVVGTVDVVDLLGAPLPYDRVVPPPWVERIARRNGRSALVLVDDGSARPEIYAALWRVLAERRAGLDLSAVPITIVRKT